MMVSTSDLHYISELDWSWQRSSAVETLLRMSSRLGHAAQTEQVDLARLEHEGRFNSFPNRQ